MLESVAIDLKTANDFVSSNHRHHSPVYRDKFRCGCVENGKLVGIVQVGRPVSRVLDDGETVEVVRLATDGTKNVCSFLYARAARVARELGYKRIITYILENELGTSLAAAGWQLDGVTHGGSWNCPSRPRQNGAQIEFDLLGERIVRTESPTCPKNRYIKILR